MDNTNKFREDSTNTRTFSRPTQWIRIQVWVWVWIRARARVRRARRRLGARGGGSPVHARAVTPNPHASITLTDIASL